jgi:hypothetical protein
MTVGALIRWQGKSLSISNLSDLAERERRQPQQISTVLHSVLRSRRTQWNAIKLMLLGRRVSVLSDVIE